MSSGRRRDCRSPAYGAVRLPLAQLAIGAARQAVPTVEAEASIASEVCDAPDELQRRVGHIDGCSIRDGAATSSVVAWLLESDKGSHACAFALGSRETEAGFDRPFATVALRHKRTSRTRTPCLQDPG